MALSFATLAARRSTVASGTRCLSVAAESFPAFISNAPATEVSTLNNGLRVASEGGHGETATVGVWIDAGSRNETAANNGVAHFLEHMTFKGTSKRTQYQLEVEIENMGGHLNAYTSREQTVYYAKVFKDDVPQAMEVLSDILLNSTHDPAAINKERDVILREMQEVQMQTEEVIFDCLHETAYQGGGLHRTILGPVENINSITQNDLSDYIKAHYTAPRMVVAGAGAVDHTQLTQLSEQYFGNLPTAPAAGLTVPVDTARFVGSDVRFREDDMGVAHVAVAWESAGVCDPSSFPLMVMQTLIGQWTRTSSGGKNMASRLANIAAEDELCQSFMSFNTQYKDTGLFGVYAVCEPKTVADMMHHVFEKCRDLCNNLTDEEVARAKTQLKSSLLMQMDGSSPTCEDIGRQMLTYGRRMTPAEMFTRIDNVTVEAVENAANSFINDQDVACAAIGAIHGLPDYNWMRRRTYSVLR